MPEVKELKKKFDQSHVVIDVKNESDERNNTVNSRRISLNTLEWLSGKVESLRRKFSATANEQSELESIQKQQNNFKVKNNNGRRMSENDSDLLEICRKYQMASSNKYTWISEPFESIVIEYGDLLSANKIEIHRNILDSDGNSHEPPRGILLLPLSSAAGQALLDFSEMGGFSLGRGSRVAKLASRALSRTHCMLYLENNQVYIKDCDSKTGTFLNGKLLGSSTPNLLENFDIIQMSYGGNREDYIQSMAVFLDNWNPKEFASSIQQLNNSQVSFSRTLSSASLATFCSESDYEHQPEIGIAKKSFPNSPLVSSPKMTEIAANSVKRPPLEIEERQVIIENKGADNSKNETYSNPPIIPERKEQIKAKNPILKSPKMPEYAEAPKMEQPDYNINQVEVSKAQSNNTTDKRVETHISNFDQSFETAKGLSSSFFETESRNQQNHSNIPDTFDRQLESAKSEGFKVHYHRKDTSGQSSTIIPSTPVYNQSSSTKYSQSAKVPTSKTAPLVDTYQLQLNSPRPPIPRPRQMKKGLSKSAENLIEVELEELVGEVEKKAAISSKQIQKTSPVNNETKSKTVKLPLEAALSARRTSSLQQQAPINVEIPEFLKAENLKIPSISLAQELITSFKMMLSSNQNIKRKFDLPIGKKRSDRLEKVRKEKAQFTTIVQGANAKRFETLVDFGSATSDISDGLAEIQQNKKDVLKIVFNNFLINWRVESLNQNSGTKLSLEVSMSGKSVVYDLMMEGRNSANLKIKIGTVQMDVRNKFEAKIVFKIDDSAYKGITGKEVESESALPLKALEQLSYFYPHLEIPTILIQGAPESPTEKVTINLITSRKSTQVGKLIFESQTVSWTKRQMIYAVDLDTSHVEVDSLMSDTIQCIALLYCLRYHID